MIQGELLKLFPNASRSCLAANAESSRQGSELEPAIGSPALPAVKAKALHPGRVHIRITSVRKRLCDPDNLAVKWHLDCLRYCGAIRDDTPEEITLETTQRKAKKGEREETVIEVYGL